MCVSFKVQGPVKPAYKPKSKFNTEDEPLLRENPHRFVLLPIQYKDIWEMYKKAEGKFETREYSQYQSLFQCPTLILILSLWLHNNWCITGELPLPIRKLLLEKKSTVENLVEVFKQTREEKPIKIPMHVLMPNFDVEYKLVIA